MSDVTNVILNLCVLDEDRIDGINEFFDGYCLRGLVDMDGHVMPDGNRWYGGNKNLEACLFLGAFNHLDIKGLTEHIAGLEYECPEDVQLIIQGQHDEHFHIIHPCVQPKETDADKLRAICEGLEVNRLDDLLDNHSVEHCRRFGEMMKARILSINGILP